MININTPSRHHFSLEKSHFTVNLQSAKSKMDELTIQPLNLEVIKSVAEFQSDDSIKDGDDGDEPKTILTLDAPLNYVIENIHIMDHQSHQNHSVLEEIPQLQYTPEWNHRSSFSYPSPIYLTNPSNSFYPIAG